MSKISDVLKALDRDGFRPALLKLDEVEGVDRETRLLAVAYARRAQHLMVDRRSVNALDVAEQYANGGATEQELEKARRAAWDAYVNSYEVAYARAGAAALAAATTKSAYVFAVADTVGAVADSKAEREWQEAELRRVCECIEAGTDPYPRGES